MLTCSLASLASFNAKALTPNEQLQAMKGVFEKNMRNYSTFVFYCEKIEI